VELLYPEDQGPTWTVEPLKIKKTVQSDENVGFYIKRIDN
jgi:hypothetical protein